MKKLLSIAVSLILALTLLCAGAMAEAAELTGEWYGSLYGIVMTLTLNEDGSYALAMDGEDPEAGTWELNGSDLIMDKGTEAESTLSYDPDEVSLAMDLDGMAFLFTREPVAAFELAAARADATLEEYAGSWDCTLVSMMGMQLPPEEAEIVLSVVVEGESMQLTLGLFDEPETIELVPAFADGALTLTIPASGEGEEDTVFTFQLLEDGTMSATTLMYDEELVFVLEAA